MRLFYHWEVRTLPSEEGGSRSQSPLDSKKISVWLHKSTSAASKLFYFKSKVFVPLPPPQRKGIGNRTVCLAVLQKIHLLVYLLLLNFSERKKKGWCKSNICYCHCWVPWWEMMESLLPSHSLRGVSAAEQWGKDPLERMRSIREGRVWAAVLRQGSVEMWKCGGCRDVRRWWPPSWRGKSSQVHRSTDTSVLCAWGWVWFPLQLQSPQQPSNQLFLGMN